jgi:putative peptide zinc metalloprotease protein
MPERSQVRASVEGFISRLLVAPDTRVRKGDPLIETEDPLLTARIAILGAQVQELTSLYQAEKLTDLVQSEIRKEELASV